MALPILNESLSFDPGDPEAALRLLPQGRAVFALYGEDERAEPYVGVTPGLRRRLERLLRPAQGATRRLQLVSRVRRIGWRAAGSEFEALLMQFRLLEQVFGAKSLERMKLRSPAFVKFHGGNPYPRLTVTNRPGWKEAGWAYGPFPSRAAAERYSEELLKLFLLRRCEENLDPNPSHPGCVYSEMKMCLAPCYQGCTDARYSEEAEAVRGFLETRGESRLVQIREARDRASAELEFEEAARLHAQIEKIESVRAMAAELVRPMQTLRVAVLQSSASADEVAVFVYERGEWCGPEGFSTLGMRIQNEQSGSSSLYAQPLAIEPVPEVGSLPEAMAAMKAGRSVLEGRMEAAVARETDTAANATLRQGYLALLTRWYYRPQQKRVGEVFFPDAEGRWPLRAMVRGAGRVAAGEFRRG